MNEGDIYTLCGMAGIQSPRRQGDWVMGSCPFSPWKHKGGSDSTPSFGIKISEAEPSGFNCFSCQEKGSLRSLAAKLEGYGVGDMSRLRKFVIANDSRRFGDNVRNDYDGGWGMNTSDVAGLNENEIEDLPEPTRDFLDENDIRRFSALPHDYILRRGLTQETCKAWDIRTDRTSRSPRIVFPIRNIEGKLLAYSKRVVWDQPTCHWCGYSHQRLSFGSRRKPHEKKHDGGCPMCPNRYIWPKYQHSKGFKRNLLLYGEHMIDTSIKTCVLVEGNIDPVWLWQCGVRNPMATFGSKPGTKIPDKKRGQPGEQLYLLEKYGFDCIVLLPDDDKAGHQWVDTIKKFFKGKIPRTEVKVRSMPSGKDPAELTPDEIREILRPYPEVFGKPTK